jgi:hypothetical protein
MYSALQQTAGSTYSNEVLLNGDGTTELSSKAVVKGDYKELKAQGDITCSVEDEVMGSMSMDAKLIQINEKNYLQYGETKIANTGDAEYEAMINDSFKEMLAGKAIAMSAPDPTVDGYKQKGVAFSILGAESKKLSPAQITDKLKEYKVFTINSSKEQKLGDITTIEYDLSVRRSAYEKFMDNIAPGYPYRTDVLNAMFDNNNEEVSLVINKDTKEVVSYTYSMPNPCIDMLGLIDPTMVGSLPEVVRIKNSIVSKNDADKIAAPADAMSEEEFAELSAVEEEEL